MSERSKTTTAIILALIILVLSGLLYLGYFATTLYQPANQDNTGVQIEILPGTGVNEISDQLYSQEVLRSKWTFGVYLWLRNLEDDLKAGTYVIPRNVNIRELSELLVAGNLDGRERTVTFIEGWTIEDIEKYLIKEGLVTHESFVEALERVENHSNVSILSDKPADVSLEGYLFPDSYRVFKDATAEEIILKMLNNLDSKITPAMRDEIEASGRSVYETLILASILEKEIKVVADLPRAAGVFTNRLKVGQMLQSDATLNYVLEDEQKKPALTAQDLKNNSPYNSYKYTGLPPTPISNPGLNAIRAAINPEKNDLYYFLTSPDGTTHFAKTYAEHLLNKDRYLK